MSVEPSGWGMLGTPVGFLRLEASERGLVRVRFSTGAWDAGYPTALVAAALRQVARYFGNPRVALDVPLDVSGTPFQLRIWRALAEIPVGQVRTYGELARGLGTSARAVGGACRANPCPILIPCHRVVGSGGLGGYTGVTPGAGLAVKRWLLRHEGVDLE